MQWDPKPAEVTRQVYQRLLHNRSFDAFVLGLLWQRLSPHTRRALDVHRWYFGELQAAENWQVPALVIIFRDAALLAQERHWESLSEIANACKALTCCDRVQIMGRDSCLRVWYDHSTQQWYRQAVPLPADWNREGN